MSTKRAIGITLLWVLAAIVFNAGVYIHSGQQKAVEFLTGYLVELSLSVDNLFVFILIFKYFKTSRGDQKKILFWGVLGAQFMRAILIFAGIGLLNRFEWLIFVFGGFLLVTGFKIFFEKEKEVDLNHNPVVKFLSDKMPMFMLVLCVVEFTDLIFALDSIPAILAITKDPLIVYSSNVFAILGLRSMYFALASMLDKFRFLHYGIGFILAFVGIKMLTEHIYHWPIFVALGVIVLSLGISILLSFFIPEKKIKYHA